MRAMADMGILKLVKTGTYSVENSVPMKMSIYFDGACGWLRLAAL
jgi:hypothetical protein